MEWLLCLKYIIFYKIIILNILQFINNYYWNEKTIKHQRQCIFPSVYKRKAIYECQHIDINGPNDEQFNVITNNQLYSSKWWCPLTDNYDHYPEWQLCPETTTTYGGNQPGKQCYFPFIYHKRLYTTCIRNDGNLIYQHENDRIPIDNGKSGYWWCSTTSNFDHDGLWTKCRPQLSYQLPCYFKKQTNHYNIGGFIQSSDYECQPYLGHWICYTELKQLRECPKSIQLLHNIKTEGGNDPGFPCYFPFQATLSLHHYHPHHNEINRPQNFTHCLPGIINNQLDQQLSIYPTWIGYWCSTTENFDRDQLWTRCHLNINQQNMITSYKLSEIWSQLNWLTLLTYKEKSIISIKNLSNTINFQQSLNSIELLRGKWELFTKNNYDLDHIYHDLNHNNQYNDHYYIELTWWLWLAPFWWITYKTNQSLNSTNHLVHTQMMNIHSNQLTMNSNNNNNDNNPLISGLNLPTWLNEWSESGWYYYNINMKTKWNHLLLSLYYKWLKSWLLIFFIGFLLGILLISFILLIIFFSLKKSIRLQIIDCLFQTKYQSIINYQSIIHHKSLELSTTDLLFKQNYLLNNNQLKNRFDCNFKEIQIRSINNRNNNDHDHFDCNRLLTLHSIHDHHDNVEQNLLDKSINDKVDSSCCCSCCCCCCDYLWNNNSNNNDNTNTTTTNTNNDTTTTTTDIYNISSINNPNNNLKEYIKCLLDELIIQHSNNEINDHDDEHYYKQLRHFSHILDIYLNKDEKCMNDENHEEYVTCYLHNNNTNEIYQSKQLCQCCCRRHHGHDDDDHDHRYHDHHHRHCCCRRRRCCGSLHHLRHHHRHHCLLECYSLNHQPLQHTFQYNNNNMNYLDNHENNEIKLNNDEFIIEPTAPPPSYDQIVPIL
ncbi:unnamed protein product [Schistosoma mattheei]|uniref:Uncharacterized protein n=1 Tax=Schistosoma mattheei TaxID=31246 RepID=A0A183NFY8_9TREM|nr:unnamed protein product [Schistosoma mattheei]